MIHYIVVRPDGSISQRGDCSTSEDLPNIPGVEIVSGDDPRKPSQERHHTYRDYRRMAYPSKGDQLDAIWKALEALGVPLDGGAAGLLERIKAVKTAHPKS